MLVKGNKLIRKDIKNILLIQLGDIGDVVLSFPCIRALKENFPKANVIVAVREKAKELIEDCPWATSVISINEEKRKLGKEIIYQKKFFSHLRELNFDIAVDLRTGTRGAILAFLSGARQRIGFYAPDGRGWRNRMFTHLTLPVDRPGQHMTEYYLNLLAAYGLGTDGIRPRVTIPPAKRQLVDRLFLREKVPSGRPVVAFQPFSLWQYKDWGPEKYVQLIRRITEIYDLSVIVVGSPDERQRAGEIVNQCGPNVFNLAGRTSIGLLTAVINACILFVGGDSAGVHIAAAADIPTVSIYGPSSPVAWAPRGKMHRLILRDMPCVPCNRKGCQGRGISRCLEELSATEIMNIVDQQLRTILTD